MLVLSKSKTPSLSLLCLFFLFLAVVSCKKDDIKVLGPNDFFSFETKGYHPRFEHLSETKNANLQPSLAELQDLRADLEQLEATYHFFSTWEAQYGTPFWDYTTMNTSNMAGAYQLAVPLVSGEFVTAILIADVGTNYEYRLFEREDIRNFVRLNHESLSAYPHWQVAAAKLMQFDLYISGYNEKNFTEWVVNSFDGKGLVSGDEKCDVFEICFSYIDWEDPSIVWTCVDIISCGNSNPGGPSGPTEGGGPNFPSGEDFPGGDGSGTGTTEDESDPDFEFCAGPCYDCFFSRWLVNLEPENCDPNAWSAPGACTIIGEITQPGNGCTLEAFIRKSGSSGSCDILNIVGDQSSASVITSASSCYIRYIFRGQIVANEDCVGEGNSTGTIGVESIINIEYELGTTILLPRHQLYDIYETGIYTIDSTYRCYHDCGCY